MAEPDTPDTNEITPEQFQEVWDGLTGQADDALKETEDPGMSSRPPGQEPTWWTLADAADAFGVSVKTLRRRVKDGKLVAQREEDDPRAPWLVREDSLIAQYGPPRNAPVEEPPAPPPTIELKSLLDDHRRMMHSLQDAYRAEAIAAAKAEHLAERAAEYREERDRLAAQLEEIRNRRWWQRRNR